MMKKMLLNAHWSPEDAQHILLFLDEIRDTLIANYGDDIAEYYQQLDGNDSIDFGFEDDIIPF